MEDSGNLRIAKKDSEHLTNNGHLFYIIAKDLEERTQLIDHLKKSGIEAAFHYVPLHTSPAGKKYGRTAGKLSITEDLSERVLRLPLYYDMTEDQVHTVVHEIEKFYK